jgi:hypothetical protein
MFVVLEAVQFRDPKHVSALLDQIKELKVTPRLVIVDTLARCYLGGDENSAQDMGGFVEACNSVQKATGAAVLAVHHTGRPKNRGGNMERGSYALRGAADVMIRVYKKGGLICVEMDKQKDEELTKPICFSLKTVVVGTDPASGFEIRSCVLVPAGMTPIDVGPTVSTGALRTLKALVSFLGHTADSGTWRKAVTTDGETIKSKTFQNHRQDLCDCKFVQSVKGKPHWYMATDTGVAMANGMPFEGQWHSTDAAANATPPKGGAEGTGEAMTEEATHPERSFKSRVPLGPPDSFTRGDGGSYDE